MCGSLDRDVNSATLATYRSLATRLLHRSDSKPTRAIPGRDLSIYMSSLFQDILGPLCADAEAAEMADSALLIAQSVVLARPAGILAAQLHLNEDPLRQVIEALVDGYAHENGGRPSAGHDHRDHIHSDHHPPA
jgi:hypothetical protein